MDQYWSAAQRLGNSAIKGYNVTHGVLLFYLLSLSLSLLLIVLDRMKKALNDRVKDVNLDLTSKICLLIHRFN